MTEKQIQRIKDKIDRIKKTLAAEKKMYGGTMIAVVCGTCRPNCT
jgi:hypothetical protein